MNILVTGNLGFVGSVVSTELQQAGHRVTGYDAGYFADCTMTSPRPPDSQIYGDTRDFDPAVMRGIDGVVHLAALSNDPLGELDPQLTDKINVGGLRAVARAAQSAGVRRFVFASSCSLYGKSELGQILDEEAPQNPLTAYARSKVAGETLLRECTTADFRPIALRFSTAYGYSPRPRLDLVVNNLVASALANGNIVLESDGTPWRPLIHVEDMAQAIRVALESDHTIVGAQAYNVGLESENYQVRTIAQMVSGKLGGVPLSIKPIGASGDQRSYNVTFGKFRNTFGAFVPQWDLARGIDDLVNRFRAAFEPDDFLSDRYFRIRKILTLLETARVDRQLRVASPLPAGTG
jgi:nucleoside-diphosphate-sugar epimerase